MKIYDKLFKPLGYKVFPRNIFYKGNYLITKELKIRKTDEYLRELGII